MSIPFCGLGRNGLNIELYSPREIEAILGISHATCYRLIAAGKLDVRKLGNKRGSFRRGRGGGAGPR
jgi:hypothetical protein